MRILFWVAIIYLAYRWFYKGSVLEAAMKQQRQSDQPQRTSKPSKNEAPKADEGEYVDFEEVE